MASPPESRPMSRRDSSTRSNSSRRPRLLRASATEPSITTSNACRNALASSQSSRRATELLSRVAFVSGSPPDSVIRSSSPMSARASMYDSVDRQSELSSSPVSHPDGFDELRHHSYSGRYFSFPSFDIYEADQQDEHKETELKSP
ncbi:hypothetical protein QBC34DRAFT_188733 [Podospora aff. communis PSN243]|uniref:Uncharacterized protein n=1 Tax=Podospora aff. communis PSN243 TaxID=3040156 RepID=A0AAV9GYZ8_9PEZI|nr:hypothetical protein QBC34DRAFT_188733 [Podospora aff. communis PSN243]